MIDHPSEIDFSLFISGELSKPEKVVICKHILNCTECQEMLSINLAQADYATLNLLPIVNNVEKNLAINRLEELCQASDKKNKKTNYSDSNHMISRIGAVLAATGVIGSYADEHTIDGGGFAKKNSSTARKKDTNDSVVNIGIEKSTNIKENEGDEVSILKENLAFEKAPTQIGIGETPGTSLLIHQDQIDTCAIKSQEIILRDYGFIVNENDLSNIANKNGWYIPGCGTAPSNMGKLLEYHGLEVRLYEEANIFNIVSELAQGHRIIVGTNSNELSNPSAEVFHGQSADHALIVSGIDTSDESNIQVIVTDPGSGEVAKAYPIDQFVNAWKDSNCCMLTTVKPAPLEFNLGMQNFNYELGHIDNIGDMAYSSFIELSQKAINLEPQNSGLSEYISEFLNTIVCDTFAVDSLSRSTLFESTSENFKSTFSDTENISDDFKNVVDENDDPDFFSDLDDLK